MSRAWMPWYIGDYLGDTGHLTTEQHGAYLLLLAHCWQRGAIPLAPAERAAVAKLTTRRWKAICGPINRFFKDDGTQARITKELEKAEMVSIRRTLAGVNSAIARGAAKQVVSNRRANANGLSQQTTSKVTSKWPDNHNHLRSSLSTARGPPETKP